MTSSWCYDLPRYNETILHIVWSLLEYCTTTNRINQNLYFNNMFKFCNTICMLCYTIHVIIITVEPAPWLLLAWRQLASGHHHDETTHVRGEPTPCVFGRTSELIGHVQYSPRTARWSVMQTFDDYFILTLNNMVNEHLPGQHNRLSCRTMATTALYLHRDDFVTR